METQNHFRTIDELIRALDRERTLLKALFERRKHPSLRYDDARELASKRDESMEFMRRYGIIRDNSDFVEMEEVYLRFFEKVLEMNEDINVASVRESIGSLNAAIDYYLSENNANRKHGYLRDVRRILKTIALTTLRNVIDLKRNIDNTYKNEPTFAIKKKKLVNLDNKRKDIAMLITECEKVMDEKQTSFFVEAMDVQLNETVIDVKLQLREAYHNLLELDRQIINYLNLIEYQNRLLQKVQKLKYLRDQMLLETNTDIQARLSATHPVWMEPRPRYPLKVSLSTLRNSDEGLQALKLAVSGKGNGKLRKGQLAEPLTEDDLRQEIHTLQTIDSREVKNAFMASGDDLFHFVLNYSYNKPMSNEERLVLFCQIATQFADEMHITDNIQLYKQQFEYPIIYPKTT